MRAGDLTPDWERCAFTLLTPDAVRRGVAVPMIETLEGLGFSIVAGRLHRATSRDVDELYSDHITRLWETYRFRLVDQLLQLGPCVPIVLTHATLQGAEMYAHLNGHKGKSDPREAAAGTLRADFGSINAVLGMMHASDDPEEAAREVQIFVAPDDELMERDALVAAIGAWGPPLLPAEERTFGDVVAALRGRIVTAAWDLLTDDLRAAYRSTVETDPASLAADGWSEPFAARLEAAGEAGLARWLRAGFRPDAVGIGDVRSARHSLLAHGLDLDPWEVLVLESSSFFAPRR